MAGERRLHRDLGRLHVANLAHQDPVGILTEDRPQAGGKRVANLRIDRHLHDPVDVVFDRVFRGDQLVFDVVELRERGVEGGGLARARGAGHQHDAVGTPQHIAELPQHALLHPDLVEIERHDAAVEHSHDDALAKERGEHAHAEVDGVAAHAEFDAAVLREPPLGDVEIRHHLDARGDREGEMLRRRHHFLEHAVGLEPDAKLCFEGLEVDVAGAVANGQQQHHVEQLPHRGALGEGLDARQVGDALFAGGGRGGREFVVALQVGHERLHALVV